jgi:stage III sporulation protein AE
MKIRILLIFCICLALMALPARAAQTTTEPPAGLDGDALIAALPEGARDALQGMNPLSADADAGAKGLFTRALDWGRTALKSAMASGFAILALCALVSLAAGFIKSSGLDVPGKVVDMTAVCAVLIICLSQSGNVITQCRAAINGLGHFSNILLPAFGIATALSGRPITAAASAGAALIFSRMIIAVAAGVFIPALYLYITASAAGAMAESPVLTRVAGFVRWISTAFFRGFLIIFTAFISISGVISGSADAVAVKTAQVTLSGVVPVVGGIISGVSESLLAGGAALRASVGVFGFLGACAICLGPFVMALCHLLVFKLLAALAGSFAQGAAASAIDGVANAYSIALGLLGTCCAVQFIAIVVSMVVANT